VTSLADTWLYVFWNFLVQDACGLLKLTVSLADWIWEVESFWNWHFRSSSYIFSLTLKATVNLHTHKNRWTLYCVIWTSRLEYLDKRPNRIAKEAMYKVARTGNTRNAMRIVAKNPDRRRNVEDIAIREILILK